LALIGEWGCTRASIFNWSVDFHTTGVQHIPIRHGRACVPNVSLIAAGNGVGTDVPYGGHPSGFAATRSAMLTFSSLDYEDN